jgi:hypothetical protein
VPSSTFHGVLARVRESVRRTVLPTYALEPFAASRKLEALRLRVRDRALVGVGALASAALAFARGDTRFAVCLALGAVFAAVLSVATLAQRLLLLEHLTSQHSAYALPEVRLAARWLATPVNRRLQARLLSCMVLVADGLSGRDEEDMLVRHGFDLTPEARAMLVRNAPDLLSLAYVLADVERVVHPAGVAAFDDLLEAIGRPLLGVDLSDAEIMRSLGHVRALLDAVGVATITAA